MANYQSQIEPGNMPAIYRDLGKILQKFKLTKNIQSAPIPNSFRPPEQQFNVVYIVIFIIL